MPTCDLTLQRCDRQRAAPVLGQDETREAVAQHACAVDKQHRAFLGDFPRRQPTPRGQQQVQIEKCLLAIQRYQLCYSYSESNCRGKSSIEGPWRTNKILAYVAFCYIFLHIFCRYFNFFYRTIIPDGSEQGKESNVGSYGYLGGR